MTKQVSIKWVRCTGCKVNQISHRGRELMTFWNSLSVSPCCALTASKTRWYINLHTTYFKVVQENYGNMNSRKNNDTMKLVLMSSESYVVSQSFTRTYFWFHEGGHQGFGRRRQQAGVWAQNQGDCLMTRQEGKRVGGGRVTQKWFNSLLSKITTWPEGVNEWMDVYCSSCAFSALTRNIQ